MLLGRDVHCIVVWLLSSGGCLESREAVLECWEHTFKGTLHGFMLLPLWNRSCGSKDAHNLPQDLWRSLE